MLKLSVFRPPMDDQRSILWKRLGHSRPANPDAAPTPFAAE